MRKFLLPLAVTASAIAVAAPAAAQWAPPPAPYGNAYGYNNAYGQARAYQMRIDQLQRQINVLDRRRVLSNREARSLRSDAAAVERRLRETARYGLSPREAQAVESRIVRLERQIYRDANDGNRRWGNQGYYGNNGWVDRDRDGRDDRYEDDRGYRRD